MKNVLKIIFMLTLFSSCLNSYERRLVGHYHVGDFVLVDSGSVKPERMPILVLNSDNTFILNCGKGMIKGEWKADDNGDFFWIEFNWLENDQYRATEGRIGVKGNMVISILNPENFYNTEYKKLSFIRDSE